MRDGREILFIIRDHLHRSNLRLEQVDVVVKLVDGSIEILALDNSVPVSTYLKTRSGKYINPAYIVSMEFQQKETLQE